MGLISDAIIAEVVEATDIVELVGSYFPLKRAGSAYKALCPFHTEKSPSFTVNPARRSFHCFGCGAGGDAIRFVMEYEHIAFPDAIKKLAQRSGIKIVEDIYDPEEEARGKQVRRLKALHGAVADWFNQLLLRHEVAGPARHYLKRRGVSSDVAKRWQLGFAPEDTGMLKAWAAASGYTERELTAGGLLSLRDEDNPARGSYARFRSRLMFPITSDTGDVIAFSGRVLDADSRAAKYMNSPETPIFLKSKTFFGFDRARRAILTAETTFVCEGQLDVITCVEAGIENMVAGLGTAFTEHHARTLARHAPEVVLCFDADAAGFKAAQRAFVELAKADLDVKVATMPQGEDPDSLVRGHGAGALREVLDTAVSFFDFQIERASIDFDLSSIKDRVALANEIAENIARLNDKIAQDTAVNNVAVRLKFPVDELRSLARQKKRALERTGGPRSRGRRSQDPATPTNIPTATIANRSVLALCKLALTDADAHGWMRHNDRLNLLKDVPGSEILTKVLETEMDIHDPAAATKLLARLPRSEEAFLVSLIEKPIPGSGSGDAQIFFLALEQERLKRELETTRGGMTEASPAALEEVMAIQARIKEIKEELSALASRPR